MIVGKHGIYEDYLPMKGLSIFSEQKEFVRIDTVPNTPLILAFLEDDDIQEIQICSTNLGIVRTFQKVFKTRKTAV